MDGLFDARRENADCEAEARSILAEAVSLYQPSRVFGMFSGGHDSRCAVQFASELPEFAGCVHINTGIGVEATREYVRETCQEQGWTLLEYRSKITYESLVLRFGFPGPAGHGMMYTRLKERCIRELIRVHKWHRHDRIMLVAGMRYSESVRRMGTAEPHHREGVRVWCSPIVNWTTDERNRFIDLRGIRKNPVVGKLCMSGECLCGAFAKPNEMAEIEFHFPEVAKQIHDLEVRAKEAGKHCVWGTRPPRIEKENPEQPTLWGLCWSCHNERNEQSEE